MLKKIGLCFYFFIAIWFISSCNSDHHQRRMVQFQQWIQNNGKLKILSTTEMINDLVKQVGGEYVDTLSLIQNDLDPHSYQLVKGDDEKLASAQQIFYSGLGLEHGPSLHRYLVQNPLAISLGDQIDQNYPGLIIKINGQKDPHIWMDISLWAKAIPFVVDALSKIDPTHSLNYQSNGKKLEMEMNKVHQKVKEIMQAVPSEKRYLVTSHDAFNYFARAYLAEEGELNSGEWERRFASPEGLAPDSQLSTSDINDMINHLKQYHIELLFPESNVSRDSIRKIVQAGNEQGLDVRIACCSLYGDAMGKPGSEGDSYLKMILYDAQILSSHMNPTSLALKQHMGKY